MKTIYVDVYFLINFTVDMLAFHFASSFTKIPISNPRLFISALFGGAAALITVFIPQSFLYFSIVCISFFASILLFTVKKVGWMRRLRFLIAFLVFEMIFGGVVYYLFCAIRRIVPDIEENAEIENRKFLLLAILVLLSIGILRLLFSVFSGVRAEKKITFRIMLNGKELESEALVDTGNLLRDPMDMRPVMILKPKIALSLFCGALPTVTNPSVEVMYRSRVIPIMEGERVKVLAGFLPDEAYVIKGERKESVKLTVAIDNLGGSFGGYDALMPSAALENVI